MRKFIALPRMGRLAFTTCVVVFALAASAPAAELTDKQKDDLAKACIAAVDVCKNSCAAKHPNHEASFNEGLLFDFCINDCNNIETRCITSIPARTMSGSSGGGLVLDPGTGNPRPPSFNPKPFSLPGGGGGVFSK